MLTFLLLAACAKHPEPSGGPTRPLLVWELRKGGHVSHLMGTCHVGVSLDDALPKPHDKALDDAKVVYTEADLDLADAGAVLRLLFSDGPGLSTRLSRERWDAVAWSVRGSVPAPMLDRMEPWAAGIFVPMALGLEARQGLNADVPTMDADIQKRAKAKGIPRKYVETLEEQAAMLAKWNDAFLAELGEVKEGPDEESSALDALCLHGDISVADKLLDPSDPTTTALVEARNEAWVPKLLPALDEGGAFVAVGAAHLLGPKGLLALLQAEGYRATRLETTQPALAPAVPWRPGAVTAAPPPPPNLEQQSADVGPKLADALCADGQVLRECFTADAETCRTRVVTDTDLCLRQHADTIGTEAEQSALMNCVPAGIVLEAIAKDHVGKGVMCSAVNAAMKAAMKGMSGG